MDYNIPISSLEAFAHGSQLPVEQIHLLVKEFYPNGNVKFDPEQDLLIDSSPPPTKLGTLPEPWINPDSAIAKAITDYRAALAAAAAGSGAAQVCAAARTKSTEAAGLCNVKLSLSWPRSLSI